MGRNKKKKRNGDDRRPRLVLSFDEEKRREYLTGFHKRKVERKRAAIQELQQRLKEEQRKLREERHQEYLKMLAEREEALEEADELDRLVTARDGVSAVRPPQPHGHRDHHQRPGISPGPGCSGCRRPSKDPGMSQGGGAARGEADQSLTQEVQRPPAISADLLAHCDAARTQPQEGQAEASRRSQDSKKPPSATRTSKTQRRRLTGRARHSGE
ncbi:nucleolar protein 12 [Lepus europaeus]|uniref:nucleolar protein 12 n=1 Tax=Lepus europaeus TaxID=9983 RepID=UPI002B4676A7|nr:nucleolar protein 12 [Lepus europaeus]